MVLLSLNNQHYKMVYMEAPLKSMEVVQQYLVPKAVLQ